MLRCAYEYHCHALQDIIFVSSFSLRVCVLTYHTCCFVGECPPEVHILVDRYDIDDIPRDRTTLELWLRESFYKKERILKEFYEGGTTSHPAPGGKIHPRYYTDHWPQKVNLQGSAFNPMVSVVAVIAWTIFVFVCMYESYLFRWVVVLYYFACMVMSLRSGYGFDKVELSLNGVTAPRCMKTKQESQLPSKLSSASAAVVAGATKTTRFNSNSKAKTVSTEGSRLL
jgi:uncharacterized membrane protein